jgi:hypothetical protein
VALIWIGAAIDSMLIGIIRIRERVKYNIIEELRAEEIAKLGDHCTNEIIERNSNSARQQY